jgi:hypothetical protein
MTAGEIFTSTAAGHPSSSPLSNGAPFDGVYEPLFVLMGKEENGESSREKAGVLREIGQVRHGERGC